MRRVSGKRGSNLTAGTFLRKSSTLFKNTVLFLSQSEFRPLRAKVLQEPMVAQGSEAVLRSVWSPQVASFNGTMC